MRHCDYWNAEENDIIHRCLDLPILQLQELLPNRTRKQILDKKLFLGVGYRSNISKARANKSLNLSETEKAYIAGLIDGEGTIGVHKGKGACLTPRVQIANTNIPILTWLLEKIGTGYVHRTEYETAFYDVKPLLTATLPYLKIKKRQAELVMEFVDLRLSRSKWFDQFTQREIEIREELRKLNMKPCYSRRKASRNEVEEYLKLHEIKIIGGE